MGPQAAIWDSLTVFEWTSLGAVAAIILGLMGIVLLARRERRTRASFPGASEEQIRLIVDSANDAFVAMNADGAIDEWNRQAEKAFGWSRAEALGRPVAETIIPSQYREAHRRGLRHFLETGEGPVLNRVIEVTALRRDGREFPIELTIAPIRLDDQYLFGAFARDITERKRADHELSKAKEAAEAANRAKSEFLANMSHEIRTPLNGILGMTDLALETGLTREQRDYLNMVKVSADSLLAVINDILDFSKIEARKLRLDTVDFSLRESLGDTFKGLALRAQQKGLELVCHVPPQVPDGLRGDPGRLRQVVVNLVGNAIKFTSEGEVVMDVAIESQSADLVVLKFAVRDTGIGIPPDKKREIFEPFAQADTSTTRQYGGTGLGLTISARLVEMMGGHIGVDSDPGTGSTFHFTARFGLALGPLASLAISEPLSLRGLPVLVVDDNATNRLILQEMLTNWRMRPALADGAPAALATLERAAALGEPFPLVLLDAMMPGVDGFALAEQIKQHPELTGAVLLMLSSAARAEDAAHCQRLGIATYLTKPIKQSELLDAIMQAASGEWSVEGKAVSSAPSSPCTHLQILLAEDNFINQRLAASLLQKEGHEVALANNGLEALAALDHQQYDLVLMDVQMPEMGGLEATAAIRQREASRGGYGPGGSPIPVIAMTAHAMKGDRERCLEAGMNGYVSKPVRVEELREAIARTLPPKGATAPASPAALHEVIDLAHLKEQVAGDEGLLKELVRVFLDSCPGMLADVKRAIDLRDAPALHRSAHALKGVVCNFSQNAAFEAAERLELMGRGKDLSRAEEAYGDLAGALESCRPALSRLLDGGTGL